MPVTRLWQRIKRETARGKAEDAKWLTGLWMMSRSITDALLLERDLPYHEKEKPPKPSQGKTKQAREGLKTAQGEISDSLASVKHFATRYGLGDVLGEPPKSVEVHKASDVRKEVEERKERLLTALRTHREKHGDAL